MTLRSLTVTRVTPSRANTGNKSLKRVLERIVVGSDQGAVMAFRLVCFPSPPSEPDVRLSPHRALHVPMPAGYAASCVCAAHGEGMAAPRYR